MKNWKTTLSASGAAIMSLLAVIAALPYTAGDAANIFPPEWKNKITISAAVAALILKVVNGAVAADATQSKPVDKPNP